MVKIGRIEGFRLAGKNPLLNFDALDGARTAMPSPATRGSGSMVPTTTLATPAATRASTQGGVRPKNVQGSRVTITVPPRAAGPATASAADSA